MSRSYIKIGLRKLGVLKTRSLDFDMFSKPWRGDPGIMSPRKIGLFFTNQHVAKCATIGIGPWPLTSHIIYDVNTT